MAYINGKQILNCEVHVQLQQTEITFKIDGTEFSAMSAMTWGEWCNTEYNTIGAQVAESGDVYFEMGYISYTNNNHVLFDEQILSKGIYITHQ